jgi:hypothetical protein
MDKKLGIALFLVFIAIVVIATWFITSQTSQSGSFTNSCLKEKEPSLSCIQILADKGILDSSACLNISNEKARGWCYYYAARHKNDISICEKITNPDTLSFCRTVLKKDPGQCDSLGSNVSTPDASWWRDNCYENLAEVNNDVSLCGRFKDTYRYVDCYTEVASYRDDIKICEKLENSDQISQCKQQFSNLKNGY